MNKNPIAEGISKSLSEVGFRKKGSNWYRASDQVSQVLNLQRSSFGAQHYINLGLIPKTSVEDHYQYLEPKEERCPIRLRIDDFDVVDRQTIKDMLDLENVALSAEQRIDEVKKWVKRIVPILDRLQTLSGLQIAARDGTLRKAAIAGRVRPILDSA